MVQGTPGPDQIRLVPTRRVGTVLVVSGGEVVGRYGPVANVDVNAGAGNDVVRVDPRLTLPTRLDGGAGNDRLRGGSGPNVLIGGGGKDTLIGTPGRDTLEGGAGRDRQIALKTMGVVQVGPSLSGAGLGGLSGAYALRPLRVAGPAVVGAADLGDKSIVALLRRDYNGGQTVALADATEADANALAGTLGVPAPVAFPDGVGRVDLVAFRKVDQGGRSVFSVSMLPSAGDAPGRRLAATQADAGAVRDFLDEVFTATPSLPPAPTVADPQANLIGLANAYVLRVLPPPTAHGDSIQIVNTAYAARSFLNQADFYYVLQEIDDHIADSAIGMASNGFGFTKADWPNGVSNTLMGLASTSGVGTLQPSPGTTQTTSTVTSGVSFTIGGSVGFNAAQGPNAGLNFGVTISNSTTKVVPPIDITYQGDPSTAVTKWSYVIGSSNLPQPSQTLTFVSGWIWQVPFAAYTPGQTSLAFKTGANLAYFNPLYPPNPFNPPNNVPWTADATAMNAVPFPFGTTFKLVPPHVTGVDPGIIHEGNNFTITGAGFYPDSVTSVVIGGQKLDPTQFSTVSDTQINVVAPAFHGKDFPVVVQTTQGVSNDDVTITIRP